MKLFVFSVTFLDQELESLDQELFGSKRTTGSGVRFKNLTQTSIIDHKYSNHDHMSVIEGIDG